MKDIFVMILMGLIISGCTTVSNPSTIGSHAWYDLRILEIDQAFAQKEITKEQQLTLKTEADKVRMSYQRDMDNQLRSTSYPYAHPFYNCNGGICTQISP